MPSQGSTQSHTEPSHWRPPQGLSQGPNAIAELGDVARVETLRLEFARVQSELEQVRAKMAVALAAVMQSSQALAAVEMVLDQERRYREALQTELDEARAAVARLNQQGCRMLTPEIHGDARANARGQASTGEGIVHFGSQQFTEAAISYSAQYPPCRLK